MQLIITDKQNYNKLFIYDYLPIYIQVVAKQVCNKKKFQELDTYFNIDSYDIMMFALKNLSITENSNEYTLKINKNLKYKGTNLNGLVNVITYGNRDIKGYPVINDIFNLIANNIDRIYAN